ncbi:MAG TPA: ribose 5-phosphate isomerase B [Candidatus Scybalocola faecipullorum]|nr:ribose 5-phosphate isomerase B [Candidatus Scybalocola faecipullorum]
MIALGCDHGGFELMKEIIEFLDANGYEYKNFGTFTPDSVDYPVYAKAVAKSILNGECELGIIVCGTGIGISIAANKFPGIRAALCTNSFMARASRDHNNANILALGGRVLGTELALDIVKTFVTTPFSGDERHIRRIDQIELGEED